MLQCCQKEGNHKVRETTQVMVLNMLWDYPNIRMTVVFRWREVLMTCRKYDKRFFQKIKICLTRCEFVGDEAHTSLGEYECAQGRERPTIRQKSA